jgi:hypothetical protein
MVKKEKGQYAYTASNDLQNTTQKLKFEQH